MYRKPILNRLLFITCLIFGPVLLSAAQGKNFFVSRTAPAWIVKIDPKADKTKLKDVNDGYYASLLEKQNQVELQENYLHIIRQIVSDAGVQNGSQITVTYDPSYQKLIFHKVIVWRNGQPTDKLDASKFKVMQNEKDLSKFIYSGTYDAYLLLDDIRKGDRIEFAYTLKGENPIFGNKYTDDLYFENSSSIGYLYTNLIANADRKLNFNFNIVPKVSDKDGLKLYEWESKQTKTYRNTDYEPSWYNPFKHTQVTEYQSWNDVVNWGLKTNSYPDLKTPLVDKKVSELYAKANKDTVKYIELAVRFVQDEIRYMGVEMGEYSHRPNSPEKVLQQRYGDCKDKSLLLVHMLNKVGVHAYMAYIDTYSGKKLNEYLPSPTLFDHVVVRIDYRHGIWIDPTISYQRGTLDNLYFPDYGQALVLKPGTTHPESVISQAKGKLVAHLTFNVADTTDEKKTTLVIRSTYTNNYADNMRSQVAEDGEDGTEKSFLEYMTKYYPDIESKGFEIKDNEQTNTIQITESYTIENIWQEEEDGDNPRKYTYFYGDLIESELRKITAKSRKEPLALKFPVNIEQVISINLPELWNLDDETEKLETDNYYFEFKSRKLGRNITLNYTYRSLKDYIEGKEIKRYVKDTKKVSDWLSYGIYWGAQGNQTDSNPYLMALAMLTIVISALFFIRIHQRTAEFDIHKIVRAKPVGGWLIVVAISLCLSPLVFLGEISTSGLYNLSTWESYDKMSSLSKFMVGTAYTIEVIANSIEFNWIILLLVLFFNRRTVFPKIYRTYLIFYACLSVFRVIANGCIHQIVHQPFATSVDLVSMILAIAFSAIWFSYFLKSERVKETFVFTYPDYPWKKELMEYRLNQFKNAHKNTPELPLAVDQTLSQTNDTDHENV